MSALLRFFLIASFTLLAFASPIMATYTEAELEILQTDRDFNQMAQATSGPEAFGHYAAEDGIMFREGLGIVQGNSTIREFLEKNSSGKLTWEPEYADAAQSSDLGYTYGKWIWTSDTGDQVTGFYVSIWKKTEAGWRFVLDTGVVVGPVEKDKKE